MASCCVSTRAVKQVSRMDQIDQMESNGLHSTKPKQIVNVMYSSVCATSERNRMNKTRIRQISLLKIIAWRRDCELKILFHMTIARKSQYLCKKKSFFVCFLENEGEGNALLV